MTDWSKVPQFKDTRMGRAKRVRPTGKPARGLRRESRFFPLSPWVQQWLKPGTPDDGAPPCT